MLSHHNWSIFRLQCYGLNSISPLWLHYCGLWNESLTFLVFRTRNIYSLTMEYLLSWNPLYNTLIIKIDFNRLSLCHTIGRNQVLLRIRMSFLKKSIQNDSESISFKISQSPTSSNRVQWLPPESGYLIWLLPG